MQRMLLPTKFLLTFPWINPNERFQSRVYAIFSAFLCLILGASFVIHSGEILITFIGAMFAAAGATFFFCLLFQEVRRPFTKSLTLTT
jgi:hypothetical protein